MSMVPVWAQEPGEKSLPAELQAAPWHGTPEFALERLRRNLDRVQSRGGHLPGGLVQHFPPVGVSGLGLCDPTEDPLCVDPGGTGVIIPPYVPPVIPPDTTQWPTPAVPPVVVSDPSTLNAAQLAALITVSSDAIAKTLAASNPGSFYRGPGGTIYTQQPGYPTATGGAFGSLTSPLGSGMFSGSGGMLLAVVAIGAVVLMSSRR